MSVMNLFLLLFFCMYLIPMYSCMYVYIIYDVVRVSAQGVFFFWRIALDKHAILLCVCECACMCVHVCVFEQMCDCMYIHASMYDKVLHVYPFQCKYMQMFAAIKRLMSS